MAVGSARGGRWLGLSHGAAPTDSAASGGLVRLTDQRAEERDLVRPRVRHTDQRAEKRPKSPVCRWLIRRLVRHADQRAVSRPSVGQARANQARGRRLTKTVRTMPATMMMPARRTVTSGMRANGASPPPWVTSVRPGTTPWLAAATSSASTVSTIAGSVAVRAVTGRNGPSFAVRHVGRGSVGDDPIARPPTSNHVADAGRSSD